MSYSGSVEEELQKIANYLEIEIQNAASLSADSVIESALRKLMSMRLKKTSEKLDVLSKRVKHTT